MSDTYDREDYRRYTHGERDPEARAANTAYSQIQRANAGEDVRVRRAGTTLSERETAALKTRLTELGITESAFIRDLVLEALGIEDTAKRQAARKPKQREKGQQR